MPRTLITESERTELNERNMERRFHALAAAVRSHEAATRRAATKVPERDQALYRRLRQICGDAPTSELPAA